MRDLTRDLERAYFWPYLLVLAVVHGVETP